MPKSLCQYIIAQELTIMKKKNWLSFNNKGLYKSFKNGWKDISQAIFFI